MNKKIESKATLTTKEVILEKSLEMINEGGMMDFRIDVLALSLNLSPGNITYHFAKKEDISATLWHRFVDEFNRVRSCISNILDIKQTFLVFREFCTAIYSQRGVVMFVSSDSRVLLDSKYLGADFYQLTYDMLKQISDLLYRNGYLYYNSKPTDLAGQTLIIRWWISASAQKQQKKEVEIERLINYNALLILFSFYNQMNDKAREEFDYISRKVADRDI